MRKLAFIHDGPIYYDEYGNYYELAYHGLYNRYRYLADDITFVMRTEKVKDSTRNTLLPKEVHVVHVPNFKTPMKYITSKKAAENIIKDVVKRSDIIVLRNVSSCANIALKYCRKYKKPYIFEVVSDAWKSLWNYSLLGKFMAPYCHIKEKINIYNSKFVYYVTDKYLQKIYPTKGTSIGCSNVLITISNDLAIKRRISKIENFKDMGMNKIVLGTAAAVDVRYKGQADVIRAIPFLLKRGYDIEYLLAGGNRLKSTYLLNLGKKLGVSEYIKFCGSLKAEEMNDFYDRLDIYIQPSRQEGLPRAVIEAMSRGCPVLGTNIAGLPELIQKNMLFHPGNYKEIAEKITFMIHCDLEKISIRNYNKSLEYCADKLENKRNIFYDLFLSEYNFR